MTEERWRACADPKPLLDYLRERASNRKLRLFACACFRRIWPLLRDERCRQGVEIFERFVDGQATLDEFKAADRAVNAATDDAADAVSAADATYSEDRTSSGDYAAAEAIHEAAYGLCYIAEAFPRVVQSARCVAHAVGLEQESTVYQNDREVEIDTAQQAGSRARTSETAAQANLVRDIFGDPFNLVVFNPSWLTSNTRSLAHTVYDERRLPTGLFDNHRLAILTDALEEAGCDNADILNHCRGPGEHVRGCWVVDLVLGKE